MNPSMRLTCRKAALEALKSITHQGNCSLTLVSRILWRNAVYKAVNPSGDGVFSVKVFSETCGGPQRFCTEMAFQGEVAGLSFPPIELVKEEPMIGISGVIVRKWVDGRSVMKDLLENRTFSSFRPSLFLAYNQLKSLWSIGSSHFLYRRVSAINCERTKSFSQIRYRTGQDAEEVFHSLARRRPPLSSLLYEAFREYCSFMIPTSLNFSLINGDPSCHEWVQSDEKVWWLDWESSLIHSPLIDLSGLFFSAAHNFCCDPSTENAILHFLVSELDLNSTAVFGYYLAERTVASATLASASVSDKQLEWGLRRSLGLMRDPGTIMVS